MAEQDAIDRAINRAIAISERTGRPVDQVLAEEALQEILWAAEPPPPQRKPAREGPTAFQGATRPSPDNAGTLTPSDRTAVLDAVRQSQSQSRQRTITPPGMLTLDFRPKSDAPKPPSFMVNSPSPQMDRSPARVGVAPGKADGVPSVSRSGSTTGRMGLNFQPKMAGAQANPSRVRAEMAPAPNLKAAAPTPPTGPYQGATMAESRYGAQGAPAAPRFAAVDPKPTLSAPASLTTTMLPSMRTQTPPAAMSGVRTAPGKTDGPVSATSRIAAAMSPAQLGYDQFERRLNNMTIAAPTAKPATVPRAPMERARAAASGALPRNERGQFVSEPMGSRANPLSWESSRGAPAGAFVSSPVGVGRSTGTFTANGRPTLTGTGSGEASIQDYGNSFSGPSGSGRK